MSGVGNQQKEPKPKYKEELSNPLIYYLSLGETVASYAIINGCRSLLSSSFDSISNEDNYDWGPEVRSSYISKLISFVSLAGFIGSTSSSLVTKLNTKHVYNLAKFGAAFFRIIFVFSPNFIIMLISSILGAICGSLFNILIVWKIYEISLPKHRTFTMNSLILWNELLFIFFTFLSGKDDGSFWYWRILMLSPSAVLVVLILVDYMFIPHVNTLSYLLSAYSKDQVLVRIENYYSSETALGKIEEMSHNLRIEKENRAAMGLQSRVEDLTIFQKFEEKANLVMRYKHELVYSVMVGVLANLCLGPTFEKYSLFFGAKEIENEAEVALAKQSLMYNGVVELITAILIMIFGLNQKRKFGILFSHIYIVSGMFMAAIAFYVKNLAISRFVVVAVALGEAFYYTTFKLHMAEVCPSEVLFVFFTMEQFMHFLTHMIFPGFIQFELSTYREVAFRLGICFLVGLVSHIFLCFLMFESDGMTREQVYRLLRGLDRGGGEKLEDQNLLGLEVFETSPHE